ncbi:MAG: aminodeoxychorismate/anthranilate synthase component II [Geodermatophilaceae bacterium]|jgi:para-aminobenzoate synthetase component 2|nr:aminodeoxychorismate/anthranilate synthase component II [Geodermatophilaceae bacterium]
MTSAGAGGAARILVVDNYDSFVFNLVQYLAQLGAECVVRRNDEVGVDDLDGLGVDGVLISPGPGRPEDAGVSVPLVKSAADRRLPLLGVCLGHQAIAVAFGGKVIRAPELLHGRTSEVVHDGAGVLAGLPSPFTATRYHSLAAAEEDLPDELEVTGRTRSGIVMSVRHRSLPIEGVQFHPESVLTFGGHQMLATWLTGCGFRPENEALRVATEAASRHYAPDRPALETVPTA